MLGVIRVPRKLPGKGLPGAAPSIVSSARGTTAIAWRRKETQTREKEGSAKPGRAGDGLRGCCLGRHRPPHHLRVLHGHRGAEAALGRWARARPTTPAGGARHLPKCAPAQEDRAAVGSRVPRAWPDDRQERG